MGIRFREQLAHYGGLLFRGMAMGASDIVPGVSGGTMAFILGIYEELIDSLRMLGEPVFLRALVRLQIRELFRLLNWQFLLAVGSGILLAVFTMAHTLEWLLVNHPVFLWSFFFGLVLASVLLVGGRIDRWQPRLALSLLVGAVGAFTLVGLVPRQTPDTWWFLFLSGALAICAMILPGVSGAFILVLLGKYQYLLSAVTRQDLAVIAIVGAGAVVGLVTFAQILNWLFSRYHDLTVALLTGLMLGSLRKVWPWKRDIAWLRDENGEYARDSFGELIVTQQLDVLPALSTGADLIDVGLAIALAAGGFISILALNYLAQRTA
mgnify:CR=1 FL=1